MKDTLPQNKFQIKALQFEDVATGKVDANKVLDGLAGVNYDDANVFKATAPTLLVKTTGGYSTYYFLNDAYVESSDSYTKGWTDVNGNYVDLLLTPGSAVWLKNPNGEANITAAGGVPKEDMVEIVAKGGNYTLIGNAYPSAVTLNSPRFSSSDIQGVNWDDANNFKITAPQLLVQTDAGYNTYYYLNDAYIESSDGYQPGWGDMNGNFVEPQINAGNGFWFKANTDTTLKFTK